MLALAWEEVVNSCGIKNQKNTHGMQVDTKDSILERGDRVMRPFVTVPTMLAV